MDTTQLITDHMELAKKIAYKYAKRKNVYRDEAVAEAYYQLCELFLVKIHVYLAAPCQRTVGIFVKSKMVNYFERSMKKMEAFEGDKINRNCDHEMIEFLSDVMGNDDEAYIVFKFMREGLNLEDIATIDPKLRKVTKKLRLQVAGRIGRLERMQAIGIKITREIKYDREMEAELKASEPYDRNSGDGEGTVHPGTTVQEPGQSSDSSAPAN